MTQLPLRPDAPWLAPLAGWSDLPFRLLCRELGAAVCCTEMVSAKGLVYGGRNTEEFLASTPPEGDKLEDGSLVCDHPLVVQIFGAEAEFMEQAVQILRHRGFCWFDVNMGCSVPKVTKTGAGAAMLRDVPNALRVAEAVIRAAGPGKVGFKLRLGWDKEHEVYVSGEPVQLTLKEYNLLHLLMENADVVVKRETLLYRVWGYDYYGETRTLDMHIKSLRRRLGETAAGKHIVTVRGVGYKFSSE